MRLKSIKNIGKITKSMKMIASTKLNRAQKAMEVGRVFGDNSAGTEKSLFNFVLVLTPFSFI
jgi:F-type H+-transporting ATPase subunit gamma